MLNLVINLSDSNMAFENVTEKNRPCHKVSYSYPRIPPSWTSIGSCELSFRFLHPPAYPGSYYPASKQYNQQKGH